MLRGRDVQELKELQRQGMSIQAISKLTGWDRKTIRKYMKAAGVPEYGPRAAQPSKLDAFKPYLEERLRAGVWNARVLLRELRERNFTGSYTILTTGCDRKAAPHALWRCDASRLQRAQMPPVHLHPLGDPILPSLLLFPHFPKQCAIPSRTRPVSGVDCCRKRRP